MQLVVRLLVTFRPYRHVEMVWCVAMSATSRARGIWKMARQTDKEDGNWHGEEFPGLFLERTCSLWQAEWESLWHPRNMLVGCYKDVIQLIQGNCSHEPCNLAFIKYCR